MKAIIDQPDQGRFDYGFAQTMDIGTYFATKPVPLPGFWITTGAALPTRPELFSELEQALSPILGSHPFVRPRPLKPQREADVAALVIRRLLRARAAQWRRYDNSAELEKKTGSELAPTQP